MRYRVPFVLAMVASTFLAPSRASGQDSGPAAPSDDHLAPFERFIGGQWHLDESYQELSWGVGRRSVRARSYFVVDGEPKLVGEGSWFWHPGEERIKGVFTAVDMPVVLFVYTTRFEEGKMVSDLRAYDADGNESVFVEIWELDAEGNRVWKLLQETPDGLREVMGGTYVRKP